MEHVYTLIIIDLSSVLLNDMHEIRDYIWMHE